VRVRLLIFLSLVCFNVPVAAQDAVIEEIVSAANAVLATMPVEPTPIESLVGYHRRASILRAQDDTERENWTYWPTERVGLELDLMTAEQKLLVHDLLLSVLSARGHLKVAQIMQLEQILALLEQGGLPRGVGHYKLVFFGEPSRSDPWGWRFEGHHVSVNVSIAAGTVAVTPSFLGSNPAEVRTGTLAGLRVLAAEEDLGRELVMSLSDNQRARAIVSAQAPNDILTGNVNRPRSEWGAWRVTLEPQGIPVRELNEAQQLWVRRILEEVAASYRPEVSAAYLRAIDVAELSFAWMGSTERRAAHYYRLQGPDFVFEYDNVQNNANHIHTVWRSRSGDFGEDLLERHYRDRH
jgi:hypothetical protein